MNIKFVKNFNQICPERPTLFCFPFAGGGASAYNSWIQKMQGKITVCPIQLPGREERIMEKPYSNMVDMLDELEENIWESIKGSYAFWGHSMGGKIAYELEREEKQLNVFWCLEAVFQVSQNQIQSIIFRTTNLKKRSEDLRERQRKYWRIRSLWISFCLCCGLILRWMKPIMIRSLLSCKARLKHLEDGKTAKQMKKR